MEVKEFIQKIRKQVSINLTSVYGVKKVYLSLYRAYMVKMYDKGYISDPTCFNEKEIRKNIRDYEIVGMVLNSGAVSMTSKQADFAMSLGGIDEEGIEFLRILKDVLYYKECCSDIDKFYDANNLESGKKVGLGVIQSGVRIYSRKPFPISVPVLNCVFATKTLGTEVVSVNFRKKIYARALNLLGITDNGQDGLFVKGMKREDEERFCDLILDGHVVSNGTESDKLESWLLDHAWNLDIDDKYRTLKTGLYTYITTQDTQFMYDCQRKLLNECVDIYGLDNVVCMSSEEVFCLKESKSINFPISMFVVFAEEEDRVTTGDRNTLEGYTGELYSVEDIKENGGMFVGCPIEMYKGDSDEKGLYVDLEQTSFYQENGVSWFSCNDDISIDFDYSYYRKGIFPEESYEDEIFKALGDSESGVIVGNIDIKKDIKLLEKAKKRVYDRIISNSNLVNRKSAIVLLKEWLEKPVSLRKNNLLIAENMLYSEFNMTQINVMKDAFSKGFTFEEVWEMADPSIKGKQMKAYFLEKYNQKREENK